MTFLTLAAFLPVLFGFNLLESSNKDIEQGNVHLQGGKAEEALKSYDRAATKLAADPGVRFDRGNALFALKRYDEAAQEFLRATEARDVKLKQSAFYNLGNAFFQGQKYKEAVEAYKRSLALDPRDQKAKWNLELALVKKKDEDKNQNEQDKKNQDKKNDDQKDKQQQNDKQQQAQNDKQNGDDGQDRKDQGEQQQQQQQQQSPPQAGQKNQPQPKESGSQDQREINAILDSLERSPKNLEQERARLRAVRRLPPEKDW